MIDRTAPDTISSLRESKLLDLVQDHWGAILGGAVAGFGATVMMALLGSALGLSVTAGAIVARAHDAESVATGLGAGALAWMLVSGLVVGAVAGVVMRKLAGPRATYRPTLFAILNWAAGLTLAVGIASVGGAGVAAGLGGAGAGAAAAVAPHAERAAQALERRTSGTDGAPDAASPSNPGLASGRDAANATLTAQERERAAAAAESAAKLATMLAWAGFATVLVGLLATIFAARSGTSPNARRTASPHPAGSPA